MADEAVLDQLHDLKPLPIFVAPSTWVWILLLGGVVLLTLIVWKAVRRWRTNTETEVPSLETQTLAKLETLWENFRRQILDERQYALGISSTLRNYLEMKLRRPWSERTSQENLQVLEQSGAELFGGYAREMKSAMAPLLQQCDQVLYADRRSISPEMLQEIYQRSRTIVQRVDAILISQHGKDSDGARQS